MNLKRKTLYRLSVLPLLVGIGVAWGAGGCGVAGDVACPEFSAEGRFGADLELDANVKTFMQAAGNFEILGNAMVKDVGAACEKIALAAGGDASKWKGLEDDAYVEAACAEADAKLQAALSGATIEVLIEPGGCRVELQATADCNASCDVSGQCTPAQLRAQCEPGKLAGSCSAECKGSCSADAGSISCAGSCDATCTGTCAGNCVGRCDGTDSTGKCNGMCEGKCDTECSGQCSGRCTYTDPSVKCEGTCHGECSVEYQAPYCEGEVTPPECMLDADCQANCEASATAQATCTEPRVTYSLMGAGGADLSAIATAVQEALPVFVVNAVERGQGLVDSAQAIATSGEAIANGYSDLAFKEGACAAAAAQAALSAATNIKASVSVSVQVSASATASAGAM